jgi:hypothetical protein
MLAEVGEMTVPGPGQRGPVASGGGSYVRLAVDTPDGWGLADGTAHELLPAMSMGPVLPAVYQLVEGPMIH